MTASQHLLILGAGIIGITSAAHAIAAGHRVTLIERTGAIGSGTSHANNALLTTSFATPFAAPGALKIIAQSLFAKPEAHGITADWRIMPRQWRWGLHFLAAARPEPYRQTSALTLALARRSLALLNQNAQTRGINYAGCAAAGTLKIFHQQREIDAFASQRILLAELGVQSQWLTPDELLAQHPSLAHSQRPLLGGWYFPEDQTGDCLAYLQALHAQLTEEGLSTCLNTAAEGLLIKGGRCIGIRTSQGELEADAVILATGFVPAWAQRYLPVRTAPVKGYSFTFNLADTPEADIPTAAVFDDTAHIGTVRIGSQLRLAGRADSIGYSLTLEPRAQKQVLQAFASLFPRLAHLQQTEAWCGLRPVTPNGLPFTGASRLAGLYANLGHAHLGWTLAHGSAEQLIQTLGST